MLSLLTTRRFAPLFWTQLFSAFNDNFLKNALVFLILYRLGGPNAEMLVTAAGGVFIAPFFFLSGLGGQLADRFDKAVMARRLKMVEILAAGVAVVGFVLHSVPVLFVALFMFGCIAALFGPIKYGILPDHLTTAELPAGNALVEGATFLAIIAGTVAGGYASGSGASPAMFGLLVMAFAFLCWGAAWFIPKTGEAAPDLKVDANIFRSTGELLRELWADARLWRTGIMVSIFWMIGAVVMSLLPPLVKNTLGGAEAVVSVYLAVFAVSIGIGSAMGSFLASGRIVLLPVPVASVLMGLFALDLALAIWGVKPASMNMGVAETFSHAPSWRVGFDLAGLAIAGGIFIVPSFAAAQAWAPEDRRARVIAGINVLNAGFMVVGALAFGVLQGAGLSLSTLFALIGLISIGSAVWIWKVLPTSPFRDLLTILYRSFYRMEVIGKENIAKAGPNAIIALNHVSFLDGGIALSILDKDPVIAIDHGIAQKWWVKPFIRATRAMPLDPTKPLATRTLIHAVKGGDSLIIFPEGRITVTGTLMKVYDGAAMIADKADVKVVPVRIEGPEATIFSRLNRLQVHRRWFPKIRVTILEPVDLKVDEALRGKARRMAAGAALYNIMSDLIFRTTNTNRSVFDAVVEAAKIHGKGRVAVEDPVTGSLTYRKLLIGARVIGQKLMPLANEGKPLGVMLPNANGASVTVLGLMSANRVPAMINFTAGASSILAACTAAEVTTIVTSRAFVEKAKLQGLVDDLAKTIRFVWLEDVRETVTSGDKINALLKHGTAIAPAKADQMAAILFTSGSEGTPKGVVLSHSNILSNVAQVAARIEFGRQDKVFNVLPVFHSFGLTAGLMLPLVSGVPVFLYPSPLHYRIVPELVYGSNATVLFGTDTFLNGYARMAHPYDFRSVRYIVAGAEPVKDSTRRTYMEKFGVRILEGYGVTETAPVLAINTPMFNKFGTVGRIMPGMEARLDPVPGVDDGGRLSVRGPNVMMGYLKADKPGVLEPAPEGWHDTGDIVAIDEAGFIKIKGRAKRFAKIGGEMVSLAAIEALAAELWPGVLSAAGTLPDPKKGERVVLITENRTATRAEFQAFAKAKGASELMMPSEVAVVEAIPVLGSGKLDFVGVAKFIKEREAASALT